MGLPINWMKLAVVYRTPDRATFINVLWYKLPDIFTGSQGAANTYSAAVDALVGPAIKPVLTADARYLGVQGLMSCDGNTYATTANTQAGAGIIAADELPSYAAVVIQKRTAVGGKSGRGRWYVGGVPDTLTDEGELTGGGQVLYEDLADAYKNPIVVGGDTAIPMHYSQKGNVLIAISTTPVTFTLGTQRRRRLRPVI